MAHHARNQPRSACQGHGCLPCSSEHHGALHEAQKDKASSHATLAWTNVLHCSIAALRHCTPHCHSACCFLLAAQLAAPLHCCIVVATALCVSHIPCFVATTQSPAAQQLAPTSPADITAILQLKHALQHVACMHVHCRRGGGIHDLRNHHCNQHAQLHHATDFCAAALFGGCTLCADVGSQTPGPSPISHSCTAAVHRTPHKQLPLMCGLPPFLELVAAACLKPPCSSPPCSPRPHPLHLQDFVSLARLLPKLHPGCFLPARPAKALVEGRRMEPAFVEERRRALERYMSRLATHPVAARSEVGCWTQRGL